MWHICQQLKTCRWFSPVSHTNKTDRHVSSIWGQLNAHLRWSCEVERPEVTWPEVTLTGSDVSHVTESAPYRKYVLSMRNRKLRNIRHSRAFWPEVTSSNVTWPLWGSLGRVGCAHAQPEVMSGSDRIRMRNRKLRNRFPRFSYSSSSTSTMDTCDRRSCDPFGDSLGCAHAQP